MMNLPHPDETENPGREAGQSTAEMEDQEIIRKLQLGK